MTFRILALFFCATSVAYIAPAAAETANCTNITSLPAVIGTQGAYCLKQDLSTIISSGSAITINTNNVTIDCNDFKIGGLAGGPATTAIGILADNRLNVTVRNCGIRGFKTGVQLTGGYHLVEHSRFDLNTYSGIFLGGDGGTIRSNRIYDTGGAAEGLALAIQTSAAVDVIDNSVVNVVAKAGSGQSVYGIYSNLIDGREISSNRVSGLQNDGSGGRYGIFAINSNGVIIRGNSLYQSGAPTAADIGIRCTSSTIGAARDNIVSNFGSPATPIANCTAANNLTN